MRFYRATLLATKLPCYTAHIATATNPINENGFYHNISTSALGLALYHFNCKTVAKKQESFYVFTVVILSVLRNMLYYQHSPGGQVVYDHMLLTRYQKKSFHRMKSNQTIRRT